MTITIESTIGQLHKGMQFLAGVCDGAATVDGQGFNGFDSPFGKSLAAQERWSAKQTLAAQKLATKYRNQLSGFGIEVSELEPLTLETLEQHREEQDKMNGKPKKEKVNKITYDTNTDSFEFHFDYNFEQKEFVKNTVGARFQGMKAVKYWYVYADRAAKTIKDYIDRYNPELEDNAKARLERLGIVLTPAVKPAEIGAVESVNEFANLSQAPDADLSDVDLSDFTVTLFPFQRAGVKYALKKKRALIGDEMGLGKTMQAIAVVTASKTADRFIVVCPASVKVNWMREIQRANPKVSCELWNGKRGAGTSNCIIINYDNLKKQLPFLLRFAPKAVIFDEMHYLKNEKSQRGEAAQVLADAAEYVLGLTGTPVISRPSELIAPLKLLKCFDSAFGGWYQFVKRYCQGFERIIPVKTKKGVIRKKIWDVSGAANLVELNEKLRETCLVRRLKKDVLKDLPSKTRAQVVFSIDNRAEYEEAEANIIDYFAAAAAENKAFLESLKGLKRVEREAKILERKLDAGEKAKRAEQLVMFETLKQLATAGIMSAAKEWIQEFADAGEPLLFFATHKEFQYELLAHFPQAARIVAEDSPEQRQANIDAFRRGEKGLMIASLDAGGTGVDGLQESCSNVGFLEFGWTPAKHLQAEDRLLRIGQINNVMAYYLIAENTIVERIQNMLAVKQAVCDSATDGAPEIASGSVFNELVDLIAAGK